MQRGVLTETVARPADGLQINGVAVEARGVVVEQLSGNVSSQQAVGRWLPSRGVGLGSQHPQSNLTALTGHRLEANHRGAGGVTRLASGEGVDAEGKKQRLEECRERRLHQRWRSRLFYMVFDDSSVGITDGLREATKASVLPCRRVITYDCYEKAMLGFNVLRMKLRNLTDGGGIHFLTEERLCPAYQKGCAQEILWGNLTDSDLEQPREIRVNRNSEVRD